MNSYGDGEHVLIDAWRERASMMHSTSAVLALGTLNANVPLRCATVNVYGHDEMFIRKILPVRPGHR